MYQTDEQEIYKGIIIIKKLHTPLPKVTHTHNNPYLTTTTVAVHSVHHCRQGYLCFWAPLARCLCRYFPLEHFAGSVRDVHVHTSLSGEAHSCIITCTPTHGLIRTHLGMRSIVVVPHKHTQSCTQKSPHTQHTLTTPGWWTTSAYPSLRPCPWRGCWHPPGCPATMSFCLPLCHPLLKCVVTIRIFQHRAPFCFYHYDEASSSGLHWLDDSLFMLKLLKVTHFNLNQISGEKEQLFLFNIIILSRWLNWYHYWFLLQNIPNVSYD